MIEEAIQKAVSGLDNDQLARMPARALDLICKSINADDLQQAGRWELWRKIAIDETDRRGIAIYI
jgi:hypothetical protein